jgi:hypothetical protein
MSIVLELGPGETFLFDTPGGTTTYAGLMARQTYIADTSVKQ